jgi:hypothetical protein
MNDKIKEIDFEELWQKICELKDKAIKADNAGLLLDGLYDNRVDFVIKDSIDRDYADDGSYEVISRDDLKAFTHNKAIEVRNKCALDILKICREIGEYNGVDFEHYTPGELE